MILKFTVPGQPQGKARARTVMNRYTGKTMSFTPEKTALYENLIKVSYFEQCGRRNVEKGTPISIKIIAGFQIPKSTSLKRERQMLAGLLRPTKKPDADNISKCILDALNGIAYHDDSQVTDLEVTKIYAKEPGVRVFIREM